jgi:type 1 glutamine amidotransferase
VARPKTLLIVGGPANYHNTSEQYEQIAGLLVGPAGANIVVTDDYPGQTRETLAGYDLIALWATYTRDMPVAPTEALFDVVSRGTPLLIMHGALYNFRDNPEWVKAMGALIRSRSIAHLPYQEATVHVDDPGHPIMSGIGEFQTADELFTLELRGQARLLASYDGRATAKPFREEVEASEVGPASHAWRMQQPHAPLVYVTQHGEGRICGNALGHDRAALSNPGFRQICVNAVRWLTE